jgi:hypothetical protein
MKRRRYFGNWKCEQKSARWPGIVQVGFPKLFSVLYAATSRYGNSAGRPLLIWSLICVGFALVYACFHVGFKFESSWPYVSLLDFSFQQTVRPFGVWSDEGAKTVVRLVLGDVMYSGQVLLIRVLATIESVSSLACIALFGFALRRRFRMA